MRNCNEILDDVFSVNREGMQKGTEENDRHGKNMHEKCRDDNRDNDCHEKQRHTHEYLGSVKIAEREEDPHNHRFAGVTGQAIPLKHGNHFHRLEGNTDFYEDHFHIVADKTGPAIPVGDGRHVHFVEGQTTVNDGHRHEFKFATLIDNPIGD